MLRVSRGGSFRLQITLAITRYKDKNMDLEKQLIEHSGLSDFSSAQSVQRCRIQSDTQYGAVHRVGQSSNETDCGLDINSGSWRLLGNETKYLITCRACLRQSNAGVQCDNGDGPCACGAWH